MCMISEPITNIHFHWDISLAHYVQKSDIVATSVLMVGLFPQSNDDQ